jgi:hypothetical protein
MERTQSTNEAEGGDEPGARPDEARLAGLRRRLRSRFTVDARSLAALRVALGSILLVDLLLRARHLGLFYTDAGVYPRSVLAASGSEHAVYSLHALSGAAWAQALLFAVAGLFALLLVVGYRTRLVGAVSLVLLFSLHLRNPAVLNGGDRLLRVLLLVALLAPLGERWSVDAMRRRTTGRSGRRTVASVATAALLVQPVAVFTSNAALKHQGETWYAGDALAVAFANDAMTVGVGNLLAGYPGLLTALNWAWIVLLGGSALFLLATVGRFRAVAVAAYLGAFAGMALTMDVGRFPFVLGASLLPFVPGTVWDAVARRVPARLRDHVADRSGQESPRALGPLAKPPLEHRVLGALRRRGHERAASYVVDYARSLLTVLGALVLVWIVLFSGSHAVGVDLPDSVTAQAPDSQQWGLYAPDPASAHRWYVVEAELADGSAVDGLDGGNVTFDPPPDVATTYETFRHRKFMESVDFASYEPDDPLDEQYAAWACRQARAVHGDGVRRVTVHRVTQDDAPAADPPDPTVSVLAERECDGQSVPAT